MEDSLNELSEISQSGVTDVILTPHYLRNVFENSKLLTRHIFEALEINLTKHNINIKIHHGAEIYLEDKIWEDIKEHDLYMGNTDYVLVETGFSGFPSNFLEILYQLVKRGYKPILAHPERYEDIIINPDLAEDLIYRNVYLQMNAGSFLGYYGNKVQRTAWKLLKRKLVHFLASDTHCNMDYYYLNEALQTVIKNTENGFIDLITRKNPEKLLLNEEIGYINN